MSEQVTGDFLGRVWVPVTLIAVAVVVVGAIAASADVIGFLLAEMIVAFSIGLRLTWGTRHRTHYWTLIAVLAAAHLGLFLLFHGIFMRAPGAVYMLAALADAAAITTLINALIREK